MKKNLIVGIAMAMGMLSVGTLSASAADLCGKCADQQAMQQFTQETSTLTAALNAKELELRDQYGYGGIEHGYDGPDLDKISAIESERKEIKNKINAIAQKYGITACSHS